MTFPNTNSSLRTDAEFLAMTDVLPAILSEDPPEELFGQARERFIGNSHICIASVMSPAKVLLWRLPQF
jgi:hypothetical protein